jgi:hypothetical protein
LDTLCSNLMYLVSWLLVDKDEHEIPLPSVPTDILIRLVAYMTHHADNPGKEVGC